MVDRLNSLIPAIVLDSLSELVTCQDRDLKVIYANKRAYESAGLGPDEIIGKTCYEIWAARTDPYPGCPVKKAMETGEPADARQRTPDGRHWSVSASPIMDGDGIITGAVEITMEITDYVQAQEELDRERNEKAKLVDISPVGITVVDRDGQITFANPAAERTLGFTRDEVTKRSYNDPEWNITDYEGNPLPDESLPFNLVRTKMKPVFDVRHAIRWPSGRMVFMSINAAPIIGSDGEFNGMVATVEDITSQISYERLLQLTNEELQKVIAEKTEFLSVISHELRSPLTPILGYSDLLLDGSLGKLPEDAAGPVAAMKDCAEDMLRLIDDLIMLSRMERDSLKLKTEAIDAEQYIRELIQDYESMEYDKEVRLEYEGDGLSFNADGSRVRQILRNLVNNAIKYSGDRVKIVIRAYVDRGMGNISVTDDGLGISEEHIPHIFKRFYQVKDPDIRAAGGTGLGLAICRELAEAMNGTISVESTVGAGSTFTISFPLSD